MMLKKIGAGLALFLTACNGGAVVEDGQVVPDQYDVIIRGGTVYDGSGSPGKSLMWRSKETALPRSGL